MIVVDASAAVQALLQSGANGSTDLRLLAADRRLQAPHLIDIEIAHVFRRLVATGDITVARGGLMLDLLRDLPIRRHAHLPLLPRVWDLRADVSAYDAVYVALAEAMRAPLLTRDRRLAAAVRQLITVELV